MIILKDIKIEKEHGVKEVSAKRCTRIFFEFEKSYVACEIREYANAGEVARILHETADLIMQQHKHKAGL